MLSLTAIFLVLKVLFVSLCTVSTISVKSSVKQSITAGYLTFSVTAGFYLRFSKRAVLTILYQTKCQPGMILTDSHIITLSGKVLTAVRCTLAYRQLTLLLGICLHRFRRTGMLIRTKTLADKQCQCSVTVTAAAVVLKK